MGVLFQVLPRLRPDQLWKLAPSLCPHQYPDAAVVMDMAVLAVHWL